MALAVVAVVIAGTRLPAALDLARSTPEGVLILIVWVLGLLLVERPASTCPGSSGPTRPAPAGPRRSAHPAAPAR